MLRRFQIKAMCLRLWTTISDHATIRRFHLFLLLLFNANLCQLHSPRLGNALQSCKISFTLCCRNCFHSPRFCIQQSAVLLSSQYMVLVISIRDFKALLTVCISLASQVADISSNLGIVNFLSGATLDLLAISIAYISFFVWHKI